MKLLAAVLVLASVAAAATAQPSRDAATVVADCRKALRLDGTPVTTLAITATVTRSKAAPRTRDMTLSLRMPDKYRREIESPMGKTTATLTVVLDGPNGAEDTSGPGLTTSGARKAPQQIVEALKSELARYAVAFILAPGNQSVTHSGVAKTPSGEEADVLTFSGDSGQLRLFVDRHSRLPRMLEYGDPILALFRERNAPPVPSTMYLGDYREVDNVLLPHDVRISVEGEPSEVWSDLDFTLNKQMAADLFRIPGVVMSVEEGTR